ncbi:MAG TPA: MFS transporter [Actinomycetota bacterium]|nr:MFS transporter [Actinomycetota bacterium]
MAATEEQEAGPVEVPSPRPGGRTFSSLRVWNFRLFVGGQLLSNTGTWMQLIGLPLLVLKLTDSGVALGVATALGYLPILLLGTWGGLLADRFDNWRLQVWTQVAFAARPSPYGRWWLPTS